MVPHPLRRAFPGPFLLLLFLIALPVHSKLPGKNPVTEGYFFTDDGVRLHYLESGQGPAIVLIPGWILPAEIWRSQLEGLSNDFHVIAMDPRSHGASDLTREGNEPIRQSHDIQGLLDHLGLEKVSLVGWSNGSYQVLAYERQFGTERLNSITLVDSLLTPSAPATAFDAHKKFVRGFETDRPAAIRNFVRNLFHNPQPASRIQELVRSVSRTPNDIAFALLDNLFPVAAWEPTMEVVRRVPLLYAVTPRFTAQARNLTRVDPLARVEFFPDAGHALFVDEPDHFNRALRNFLRNLPAGPAPSEAKR